MNKVKYINPYTDFGFKKLFGEEGNKDLLIDFLNQLVAILDFEYDEEEERRKFRRDVALKDQDGDLFYDKLHFKFLQMPLFTKKEDELESRFDKWCYFLKHLQDFDHIPAILNEPIFQKAFKTAELANLTSEQRDKYDYSLIQYWDMKSVIETAVEEREIDIVKKAILKGLDNQMIAHITNVRMSLIEKLRKELENK